MSPKLISKIHTKWIVICSILLTIFGLCGFSISSGYWMLFIFAIPYGLGAGVIDSAVNHYAANNYSGSGFGYAGADYDSVYGKVTCRWKKNADGYFEYDIVVPPNTTASLEINGVEERILNAGIYHFAVWSEKDSCLRKISQ